MQSPIKMNVSIPEADPAELQSFTLDLRNAIRRYVDAEVELPDEPGPAGSKGDAGMLGQLLITLLTSGAAAALIDVFKPYFARQPKLELELTAADGTSFKLRADQISVAELPKIVNELKRVSQGKK